MQTTTKTPLVMLTLAALGLGGACTALSAESQGDLPVTCALTADKTRHGTTLTARTTAHQAVHGHYAMDIVQKGAGGRAEIRQSGDFSLRAGQTETLGQVTLSHDPNGYEATLKLRVDGVSVMCRSHPPRDI